MTHLNPADSSTKRLTLPGPSEHSSKRMRLEIIAEVPTLKRLAFVHYNEMLVTLPLRERVTKVISENLPLELELEILQPVIEEALRSA